MLGFILGLVVGWFFLPIPQFAQTLFDKLLEKVPFLNSFKK